MSKTKETKASLTSEYVLIRLDQTNKNVPLEPIGIYHTEEEAYADGLLKQMQAIEENKKLRNNLASKHEAILTLCKSLKDEMTNYKERFEYLSSNELFKDGIVYKILKANSLNGPEMNESIFKTRVRNFQDVFQSQLADDEEDLEESNDEDDDEEDEEDIEEEDEEDDEEVEMEEGEEEEVQEEDEDIDEVEEDLDEEEEELDEEEDIEEEEEEEEEPAEGAVPEAEHREDESGDEHTSQKRSRSQTEDEEEDEIEEEEEEEGDEDELEEEEELSSNKKQRVTA